jgi:hypothetical protein
MENGDDFSRLCTKYIKVVGGHRDIGNDFYLDDSLNDYLEKKIYKGS